MKVKPKDLRLYAITDRQWLGQNKLSDQVESVIKAGASFIQLREKELAFDDFVNLGKTIKSVTDFNKIPFLINDNIAVALACDADGVHLGQSDMDAGNVREKIGKDKILGMSVQTIAQALEAQKKGADYLGVGAMFFTQTKTDAAEVSMETLKKICESVRIPVVAIGGINEKNILELSQTGVDGIAVISAIFKQPNVFKAAQKLRQVSNEMVSFKMKKVLSIAGSDCSGGAGIQADLKTMMAHNVYGMTAITALTAQNTTGVFDILEVDPKFVEEQLDAVFNDIVPDAIKIGMLSNPKTIEVIVKKLIDYQAKNIVIDPVMLSTSGSQLLKSSALEILIEKLLPLGTLITPNIFEAERLCGFEIKTKKDMLQAARFLSEKFSGAILIKGGHSKNKADDLLCYRGEMIWFFGEKIKNKNTHGTGCTLSSAIACALAMGNSMEISVKKAKDYVSAALADGFNLGKGSGPLNHGFNLN